MQYTSAPMMPPPILVQCRFIPTKASSFHLKESNHHHLVSQKSYFMSYNVTLLTVLLYGTTSFGPSSLLLGHCMPRFARHWAPLPSALRLSSLSLRYRLISLILAHL